MENGNHQRLLNQLEPILDNLGFSRVAFQEELLWGTSLFKHRFGVYINFVYDHLDQLTIIMFGRKWIWPDRINYSLSARYDHVTQHFGLEAVGVFYIDRSVDNSMCDYNNRISKYLSKTLPVVIEELTFAKMKEIENEWIATINRESYRPRSWAEYSSVEPTGLK
jgi:hypothetical protein